MRALAVLVTVGTLLVAVGCATTTGPAATTVSTPAPDKGTNPPLVTDPFADPASDHEIVYGNDLVSDPLLDPPPSVRIDETAARAVAANDVVSPYLQPGEPTATLRMVKVGLAANSEVRPAWVLIWSDSHPVFAHAVGAPADEASRMAGNADCEMVVVVDAISGQTHGAAQYCRHK